MLTGLSLAFATIPEELPLLIAGVLAVGALALAQRQVCSDWTEGAPVLLSGIP